MKFFGITRFNLITEKTLKSFRATQGKTLDAAKKELYDLDRLRARLELFKNLCLPTYSMLSRQSVDTYGLILINEDFPSVIKNELNDLCSSVPRVSIIELSDSDGIVDTINPLIKDMCNANDKIFTYRYDDDDALSVDFLKEIAVNSTDIETNTVISFKKGYCLSRTDRDNYHIFVRNYPMNAFGLGVVSTLNDFKSIFELGPHYQIKEPTILIDETLGWLCTVHADNDSRVGKKTLGAFTKDSIIKTISEKFPQVGEGFLTTLTYRRDEDRGYKLKTFHKTYLVYSESTNNIIQVEKLEDNSDLFPVCFDKIDNDLFITINSKKKIFKNFSSNEINFLSTSDDARKNYIVELIDKNKISIKIDGKYLSARKSSENIEFKLQPVCDKWEMFAKI